MPVENKFRSVPVAALKILWHCMKYRLVSKKMLYYACGNVYLIYFFCLCSSKSKGDIFQPYSVSTVTIGSNNFALPSLL